MKGLILCHIAHSHGGLAALPPPLLELPSPPPPSSSGRWSLANFEKICSRLGCETAK